MNYTSVALEQGSEQWLNWRRSGFGASDISVIMGENGFVTYEELIAEKQGGLKKTMNDAMARGVELEPIARTAYIAKYQVAVTPVCIQHNDYRWARASLDGLSFDGNKVVEIKCGTSSFKKAKQYGAIPSYYAGQLQHILFITGLPTIDYWAFDPQYGGVLIVQKRDERYIQRIVEKCEILQNDLPKNLS